MVCQSWAPGPLLLSQPISGAYYDYVGVSQQARTAYYARLRDVAARYAVPVVFYDQALDAFFHDRLDVLAAAKWSASALTRASFQ